MTSLKTKPDATKMLITLNQYSIIPVHIIAEEILSTVLSQAHCRMNQKILRDMGTDMGGFFYSFNPSKMFNPSCPCLLIHP